MAIVTVPTLILLALLLDANLQDSACCDDPNVHRSSFIVLIFGFGFLVVSLLVCGCIAHKMGFCSWTRPMVRHQGSRLPATATTHTSVNNSELEVGVRTNDFVDIDLPPSYDSIVHAQKCETNTSNASHTAPETVVSISQTLAISSINMDPSIPPPTYESLCSSKRVNDSTMTETSYHI